jgi:hypothetical protein
MLFGIEVISRLAHKDIGLHHILSPLLAVFYNDVD